MEFRIKMEAKLNGYEMDMEKMKVGKANSPLQTPFWQITTKHFYGLVGLDRFIRKEQKGMERNGNTKKERQLNQTETKFERK